jgi:hypothetical protein
VALRRLQSLVAHLFEASKVCLGARSIADLERRLHAFI